MHNIKDIRNNLDIFKNSLKKRNVKINIDEIIADKNDKLYDFSAISNYKKGKQFKLSAKANFSDTEFVDISITPKESGKKNLVVFSDRAAPFIQNLKFIKGFEGGKLEYVSNYDKRKSISKLKITDFKLQDVPVLAKLLTLASLQGIADLLTGEGIRFKELDMDFNSNKNLITIDEMYAIGPSISILMSGYIEKDVWEVFTAGLDLGDKSTIELSIPNYFIDTIDEVTEIEVKTEYYIEPKPSGAPGPADDFVSEFGQWIWDPVETNWSQNVKGISYDENNVPIWPQDKLINGYPLNKAIDPTLFDNGTPLVPEPPKDTSGDYLFITSFTDSYDGREDFGFNRQFLYWYDRNIMGNWVYQANPDFTIFDMSENDIASLQFSFEEFINDHMYRDVNDPFFTKTIEKQIYSELDLIG